MNNPELIVAFLLATGCALALTPLSWRLAMRIGAIDHPGERRIHAVATPRLGGPAIFLALFGGLLLAARVNPSIDATLVSHWREWGSLAVGALMIVAVGVIDDVRGVRPVIKLAVETVAALVAIAGGYRLETLGAWHCGVLSVPLTVILIVAVVNAVNLVDGLDGLAVGLCLMMSATLLALNLSRGAGQACLTLAALCGAMAGFLPYNFHRARIFLGDSGALLLGFLVASATIATAQRMPGGAAPAFAPFLLLALPVAELTLTVMRRFLRAVGVVERAGGRGRYRFRFLGPPALFRADRDHIHHRMLGRGLSHRESVLRLYAMCGASCAAAMAVALHHDFRMLPWLAAIGIGSVAGVRWLGYREFAPLRSGLWLPLLQLVAFERKAAQRASQVMADLVVIVASCGVAMLLDAAGQPSSNARISPALPLLAILQIMAFAASGLYRRMPRRSGMDELLVTAKALGWASIAGAMAALILSSPGVGVRWVILDTYLLATMTLGARLAFRGLERLFESERARSEEVPALEVAGFATNPREPLPYGADDGATARRSAEVIPIRSAGVPN